MVIMGIVLVLMGTIMVCTGMGWILYWWDGRMPKTHNMFVLSMYNIDVV